MLFDTTHQDRINCSPHNHEPNRQHLPTHSPHDPHSVSIQVQIQLKSTHILSKSSTHHTLPPPTLTLTCPQPGIETQSTHHSATPVSSNPEEAIIDGGRYGGEVEGVVGEGEGDEGWGWTWCG
jgi:hypothetical protein